MASTWEVCQPEGSTQWPRMKNPEYHGFTFPFILMNEYIHIETRTEAGSFHSEELFPNKFIKHLLLPHNSQQQTKRCYRTPPLSDVGWGRGGGCQDMLRWSGQNANQKVDPDKMPTTEKKSRTKCQPRLAFCPVGILSGWHFVLPPIGVSMKSSSQV